MAAPVKTYKEKQQIHTAETGKSTTRAAKTSVRTHTKVVDPSV